MADLGSSKGKRSGPAGANLLGELESYRRRVRELEQNLAERDLREAADRKEVSRLARAFQPARIRAWCWTAEARLTQYLPIRGDVRDSRGRPASQISLAEERLLQAIHPDDRERVASIWDRAFKEHLPYEIEYRLVLTDGEVRHNHEIGRPEFDESGRYLGHCGTTQDITDRKRAEEALRETRDELELRVEERTRDIEESNETLKRQITEHERTQEELERLKRQNELILRSAGEGIYGLDTQGRTTFVNPAAARMIGWKAEELIGRPQHAILHHTKPDGSPYPREECPIYAAFKDGSVRHVTDELFWRKDGSSFPVEYVSTPIRERGEIIGAVVVFRNIGDQKRAQETVFAAKEQAEQANRAKSAFLANMSHELRTPLNAIIGFSDIIKNERLGPVGSIKYRGYANDINDSGRHLLDLINDILDLSKIESGTGELHEENIEISETANAIMKLVKGLARTGNVELELDVSDDIAVLRADERKVKQILLNLLSNAIKFTLDGGKVTLKIWSRAESRYVFQVIDTGIGIALEDIPRALAPFQQIDRGLNRKHEGTGLGLPLTKALVEMHGGHLELQSEVGVGTTATVRFPAERIVGSPRARNAKAPGVTTPMRPRHSGNGGR